MWVSKDIVGPVAQRPDLSDYYTEGNQSTTPTTRSGTHKPY